MLQLRVGLTEGERLRGGIFAEDVSDEAEAGGGDPSPAIWGRGQAAPLWEATARGQTGTGAFAVEIPGGRRCWSRWWSGFWNGCPWGRRGRDPLGGVERTVSRSRSSSCLLSFPGALEAQSETRVPGVLPPGGGHRPDGLAHACELDPGEGMRSTFLVTRSGEGDAIGIIPPCRTRLAGGHAFVVQSRWTTEEGGGGLPARVLHRTAAGRGPSAGCPEWTAAGNPADSEFIAGPPDGPPASRDGAPAGVPVRHCFGRSGGKCRWHEPDALTWEGTPPCGVGGRGTSGNYPVVGGEGGHYHLDTCDHHDTRTDSPGWWGSNIASADHPRCIEGSELATPFVDAEGAGMLLESAGALSRLAGGRDRRHRVRAYLDVHLLPASGG